MHFQSDKQLLTALWYTLYSVIYDKQYGYENIKRQYIKGNRDLKRPFISFPVVYPTSVLTLKFKYLHATYESKEQKPQNCLDSG